MFHYILKNAELNPAGISFEIKNSGKKDICSLTIFYQLAIENPEYNEDITLNMQKTFEETIFSGRTENFFIPTSEYMQEIENSLSEQAEDSELQEYSVEIKKIYIREIILEDGTEIKDRFGLWSF